MINRRKRAFWLVVLWTPAVVCSACAMGANGYGQLGFPAEMPYSGTVKEVKQQKCEDCKCIEMSVLLNTADGLLEVRLGPKAFLDKHHLVISTGDSIRVTGMRFSVGVIDSMVANDVRKGRKHLVLRGRYGQPKWIEDCGN
jgi:hypothetical protein